MLLPTRWTCAAFHCCTMVFTKWFQFFLPSKKLCVWCVHLLWVYTALNIQFTTKIHGENVCVCVCSLWELIFDRKLIMFFFLSFGADVRRYFSLFLLSHNGFFVFKWHCVGEYYNFAFSLSQNQRHHVLAVSQQVYWISSSSDFSASKKSLVFEELMNC